jgi:hypothetical protein
MSESPLIVFKGEVAMGYTVTHDPPPVLSRPPVIALSVPPRDDGRPRFKFTDRLKQAIGVGSIVDADTIGDDRYIVAKGGRHNVRPYEIGVGETKDDRVAYADLANMELSLEGVLEFVGRWGLLVPRSVVRSSPGSTLLTCSDYYCAKHFVAGALTALTSRSPSIRQKFFTWSLPMLYGRDRLGTFRSRLGWGGANLLHFHFETDDLLKFCLIDLITQHTSGTPFAKCPGPGCDQWLHRRKFGRPQAYCGDACRLRLIRKRERDAKKPRRR